MPPFLEDGILVSQPSPLGEGLYRGGFAASFFPFRMTIRESSSWRVGESFDKHTKSALLGRGALFVCCGIVDDPIMISSVFPVDYFPVSLFVLPVDVPKEE